MAQPSLEFRAARLLATVLVGLVAALLASAPAAARDDERPVTSAAGATGKPGALLEGVAGRVVSRSGRPLQGVLILPSPAGGGAGPVPERAVLTDAEGRFEWSLGPGRYRLQAVLGGRTVGSRRVAVTSRRVTDIRMTIEAIK